VHVVVLVQCDHVTIAMMSDVVMTLLVVKMIVDFRVLLFVMFVGVVKFG
jgi:hypothetical protein